jgi:glucose-1-phosphate cytidylyltransferase
VNIKSCIEFHKKNKFLATLTAVQPPGKFGALDILDNKVKKFREKPRGDSAWVNGGFFVFEKDIIDYIKDDNTVLEKEPLELLAKNGKLGAFKHEGFFQPMDTLRDKNLLEELWSNEKAPWKIW